MGTPTDTASQPLSRATGAFAAVDPVIASRIVVGRALTGIVGSQGLSETLMPGYFASADSSIQNTNVSKLIALLTHLLH